jgi:hypothetical protein
MFRLIAVMLIASFIAPSVADAADRSRLGYGRLITNDFLGDLQDRERTGSVMSSRVWGPEWTGSLPTGFGDLIELRLGMEVLAPEDLVTPAAGTRPWAGALSAGIHSHYRHRSVEYAVGAAIYMTGPQNGLGRLQQQFHELIGDTPPSDATLNAQIGNGFHPTVRMEAARVFDLGTSSTIRPFIEGQAGIENLMRAGVDFTYGNIGKGELLVRDHTSGHRYRVIQNSANKGFSFVAGADIAYVSDSTFLPQNRGYNLTDHRDRARVGVHWQGEDASAFYGVTWLGKEYDAQPNDQVVGSLRVNFNF